MPRQNYAVRVKPEPLRTLAFGAISGTYAMIGTALAFPSRKLIIQNLTDVVVTFSDDGTTDVMVLPAGGMVILDRKYEESNDYYGKGTQFYAMGAPTMGAVYLSTWYGAF